MGFKKDWDMNAIKHQIWAMQYECTSFFNDGFTAWEVKKELYELKWLIDDALNKSGPFSPEKEWLKEQEQNKIVKILKK